MHTHLTHLLPGSLRAGVRSVLDALRDPQRRRHWLIRAAGRPHRCAPRVSYGRPMPRRRAIIGGGLVKFTRLALVFPHSSYRFNVLYLGSSSMPEDAMELVELSKAKGARFVWNQNGVAYAAWHPNWQNVNRLMASLMGRADHVFYQSDFCRTCADHFLGRVDAPTEILYNPVDTDLFIPAAADPEPGGLVLLSGGTIEDWYRFEAAARTVACLRDAGRKVFWLVAGRLVWHASAAQATREAVALLERLKLGACVRLMPSFSRTQAPALFRTAHLFLHTKCNDPCPNVVLEAMASGLPVAYSRSGGTPELVGEAGVGVGGQSSWDRFDPPAPSDLAEAVLKIDAHRADYAAAARRRAVEHFGLDRWIDRHRQVFAQLLRQ